MKLEIKHLAPYLPYELGLYYTDTKKKYPLVVHNSTVSMQGGFNINEVINEPMLKPILRPMSDLINPILKDMMYKHPLKFLKHGGTDIDQLRKTMDCFGGTEYSCCDNEGHETRYNVKEMTFTQRYSGETRYYKDHYDSMCKLFEWHFDVFGLIEKGLAIDINTIENV